MKRKNGFTLIELIAVLVILAILALIVTPLVMNIIRKARTAADKRSIDAYGRSIELAIAGYLLDTGKFPTSVEQLTIEYTGDEVICSTTQLNSDSSVYLAGCTVAGRSVDYTYGKEETITYNSYSVGDEVTYNNVDYYVIEDSDENEETVTLLKAEPLTVAQVNQYGGVGTANNHVNEYALYRGRSYNIYGKGYGGMAYYSSETCGYGDSSFVNSGCKSDYTSSEVKYVVDAWKTAEAPLATSARLITVDDLKDNLGMELNKTNPTTYQITVTEDTPTWVFDSNYYYWTMTPDADDTLNVWSIGSNGLFLRDINSCQNVYGNPTGCGFVRPVIVLSKSALN